MNEILIFLYIQINWKETKDFTSRSIRIWMPGWFNFTSNRPVWDWCSERQLWTVVPVLWDHWTMSCTISSVAKSTSYPNVNSAGQQATARQLSKNIFRSNLQDPACVWNACYLIYLNFTLSWMTIRKPVRYFVNTLLNNFRSLMKINEKRLDIIIIALNYCWYVIYMRIYIMNLWENIVYRLGFLER